MSEHKNVTIAIHGANANLREAGLKLGLTGKKLELFMGVGFEVKLEVRVNLETGEGNITKVDGRKILDEK